LLGLQTSLALAEAVQSANFYLGDPRALGDELAHYQAVTSADLQRVAAQYLNEKSRTVIRVQPEGEDQ
jgi:predicted Zn-dependent peptidase